MRNLPPRGWGYKGLSDGKPKRPPSGSAGIGDASQSGCDCADCGDSSGIDDHDWAREEAAYREGMGE